MDAMSFVALKFKTLPVQVFGQPQLVTSGRGAGLKVGTLFGDVGGGRAWVRCATWPEWSCRRLS